MNANLANWQKSNDDRMAALASGLADANTQLKEVRKESAAHHTAIRQTQDLKVWEERDHRRLLLGDRSSARVVEEFRKGGRAGLLSTLQQWCASYRAGDDEAGDWDSDLAKARVYEAEQFLGPRVVVQLPTKAARDEICRQLALSPLRQEQWPTLHVAARLTSLEQRNKLHILHRLHVPPADPSDTRPNREFLPGRKVQINCDVAVVKVQGHADFRIALGLSEASVAALVDQVLQR